MLREGAILGVGGFAAFLLAGGAHSGAAAPGGTQANTLAFHGLISAQLLHTFACRSETHGLLQELQRPPNWKLVGAVGAGLALQLGAQTFPPLKRLLQLTPLGPGGFCAILATALGPLAVNEILTAVLRRADGLPET